MLDNIQFNAKNLFSLRARPTNIWTTSELFVDGDVASPLKVMKDTKLIHLVGYSIFLLKLDDALNASTKGVFKSIHQVVSFTLLFFFIVVLFRIS